jgi:putative hydrolase of the HAD superfamily
MIRSLPQPVRTVLFDAGGVLLDLDYRYLRRLVDSRRHATTEDALARAEAHARQQIERRVREGGRTGEAWRDYFHFILAEVGVPAAEHEAIIDALWEAHERVGLWTVAIGGGPDVVRELKGRGLRIGVVSNAEGRVARDLELAGYGELLETVVDSHVVGVEKPDPEIFRIALRELGMPPDTAVYLGDVPSVDIEGARAASIAPILLDRHDLYPEAAAIRLRSIRELPALLDGDRD